MYKSMKSEEITATFIQVFSIKRDGFMVSDANNVGQDHIPLIDHEVNFMKVSPICSKNTDKSNHSIFSITFNFTIINESVSIANQ